MTNTEFEQDWLTFLTNGSLLDLTKRWEESIPCSKKITLKNRAKLSLSHTGILSITPEKLSNVSIVISSGIHGNETAPIEIMDELIKGIINNDIQVKTNILLIIGNPPAMNISQRFLTQNLNRLFSQKHKDSDTQDYETARAEDIEKAVSEFYGSSSSSDNLKRFHFDLHTAIRASKFKKFVVYPYQGKRPWDKEHIAFFGGSEITTVLLGNQPAGTFSYFTSDQFGANSATVELGKVKPFGENDMKEFDGITNNLRSLIENLPTKSLAFDNEKYRVFQVKQEIIKKNEEFELHVDDDLKNFTAFQKGHLLASDGKNEKYIVENDGEAIVFPNNNVPVGQRVAVLLEEVSL
ncbi:MAG: succinylglutamate desuccinylase [Polaribacter sp.]|jgi:succinylglutamate desuccinylase